MERAGDSPEGAKVNQSQLHRGSARRQVTQMRLERTICFLQRRVPIILQMTRRAVTCQGPSLCGWELRHAAPPQTPRKHGMVKHTELRFLPVFVVI